MEDTSLARDFSQGFSVTHLIENPPSEGYANKNRSQNSGGECPHLMYQARTLRAPMTAAVGDGYYELDNMQLNSRANQLARYLRARGIRPGDPIGIVFEPAVDTAILILGALKVGAYIMPVKAEGQRPASLPADATVLAVDAPDALVCVSLERDWHLIAEQPGANPAVPIAPFQLACRNFSGKESRHDAIARRVAERIGAKGLIAGDTVEVDASLPMDNLLIRCFSAWLTGAKLVFKEL